MTQLCPDLFNGEGNPDILTDEEILAIDSFNPISLFAIQLEEEEMIADLKLAQALSAFGISLEDVQSLVFE